MTPKFEKIGYQKIIKKMIKKKSHERTQGIWVLAPNKPLGPAPPEGPATLHYLRDTPLRAKGTVADMTTNVPVI